MNIDLSDKQRYNKDNFHLTLPTELRKLWAEKTLELTNIGAGATLFSQFFTGQAFSWPAIIVGFIMVIVGHIISYILYKK